MKRMIIGILVCVCTSVQAQTNFVLNPSFENYTKCPDGWNQISRAQFWTCAVDTVGEPYWAPELFNSCASGNLYAGLPENIDFYQYTHSGKSMSGVTLFYDKTSPPPPGVPFNYRDYIQGRLLKPLTNGKKYCVAFWINMMDRSGYAQNKMGAYLDDGSINIRSTPPGTEINDVVPQLFTLDIIKDTANWIKVEGSFTATGIETYITLGTFFKNDDLTVEKVGGPQYSYYLIDDVSVVESDLKAEAGPDVKIPVGKAGEIGRVGDTTAGAIDCKWYHNGVLVDSGAVIIVNGSSIVGEVDTYVVVQTICGNITRDTALVRTVPVGILEAGEELYFSIYPNPSEGSMTISGPETNGSTFNLRVYDLTGRILANQSISNFPATLTPGLSPGAYLLELIDKQGNIGRKRALIR